MTQWFRKRYKGSFGTHTVPQKSTLTNHKIKIESLPPVLRRETLEDSRQLIATIWQNHITPRNWKFVKTTWSCRIVMQCESLIQHVRVKQARCRRYPAAIRYVWRLATRRDRKCQFNESTSKQLTSSESICEQNLHVMWKLNTVHE